MQLPCYLTYKHLTSIIVKVLYLKPLPPPTVSASSASLGVDVGATFDDVDGAALSFDINATVGDPDGAALGVDINAKVDDIDGIRKN